MIPAYLYSTVFLYLILILTLITCVREYNKSYEVIERGSSGFFGALILAVILSVFLGGRPLNQLWAFGDSALYAHQFNLVANNLASASDSSEWAWGWLMKFFAENLSLSDFFLFVEIGYIGSTLWACKRLTSNCWISFLFMLASFSFYSYGVNGIRNGLACALVLVVMSYAKGNIIEKIIAAALGIIAFGLHHTTILPLAMLLISMYFIKSFKWAYTFWILSILLSLVAGGSIINFFVGLGFDDRMAAYSAQSSDSAMFSHTGFRWDFLIYSMMPIVLGYYVVIKKKIRDSKYELLLNTYTLANAFWVMVIRANYSNRFAYLSWFMYPLVLAYPVIELDIWGKKQGYRLAQIMGAHALFTWFMATVY